MSRSTTGGGSVYLGCNGYFVSEHTDRSHALAAGGGREDGVRMENDHRSSRDGLNVLFHMGIVQGRSRW